MYLKKAVRGTIIVFIFTVLAGILWYVFRLILARNLSLKEYGLFYAVYSMFALLGLFVDLGLGQAVPKFIVDLKLKKKFKEIKSLSYSVLVFQFLLSVLVVGVLLLFSNILSKNYFDNEVFYLILILGVWFCTTPFISFVANILYGFNKNGYMSSIDFVKSLFLTLFAFLLFYNWQASIYVPLLGYALLNFILMIIYFPLTFSRFKFVFKEPFVADKSLFKSVVKYGFLISLSGISWLLLTQTDVLLLTHFKGVEIVALYGVAVPLASVALYLVSAMSMVALPLSSELYARNKKAELSYGINLFYRYMLFLLLPLVIILFSFSGLIIEILFGYKYVAAAPALQVLAIGALFSSYALFNNNILLAIGKAKMTAKFMVIVALLNIIFNIIMIPRLGIVGAALSTVFSFLLLFIFTTKELGKSISINLPFKKWFFIVLNGSLTVLLIFILRKIISVNYILETLIILILAAVFYVGSNLLSKSIDVEDIKYVLKHI